MTEMKSVGIFSVTDAPPYHLEKEHPKQITRKLEDQPERSEHTIRSLTGGDRSSVDSLSKDLHHERMLYGKFYGNTIVKDSTK